MIRASCVGESPRSLELLLLAHYPKHRETRLRMACLIFKNIKKADAAVFVVMHSFNWLGDLDWCRFAFLNDATQRSKPDATRPPELRRLELWDAGPAIPSEKSNVDFQCWSTH